LGFSLQSSIFNRQNADACPLFRSAAQVYGPAAIGVVLTGNLDDGTAGLWAIKQLGGTAIVQDPEDALYPSMPRSAMRHVQVDYSVPLRDLAPLLIRLTEAEAPASAHRAPDGLDIEVRIAREEDPMAAGVRDIGAPSTFACPECHGVLLELKEGKRVRFRCHTGHAYSIESLLVEINGAIETSLWNTLRSMQEGTMLMQEMAKHAEAEHPASDVHKLTLRARELQAQADTLRAMVGAATAVGSDAG
jgi:two-component system, chemotaxis family, protein-glutamate methylesterase/glutaminase